MRLGLLCLITQQCQIKIIFIITIIEIHHVLLQSFFFLRSSSSKLSSFIFKQKSSSSVSSERNMTRFWGSVRKIPTRMVSQLHKISDPRVGLLHGAAESAAPSLQDKTNAGAVHSKKKRRCMFESMWPPGSVCRGLLAYARVSYHQSIDRLLLKQLGRSRHVFRVCENALREARVSLNMASTFFLHFECWFLQSLC